MTSQCTGLELYYTLVWLSGLLAPEEHGSRGNLLGDVASALAQWHIG
jgi:hypothetical protein